MTVADSVEFDYASIKPDLLACLRQTSDWSEYELLDRLNSVHAVFQTDRTIPLNLFRQHFILFHCLYRLQQELWQAQTAHLTISPLRISLAGYQPGQAGLMAADPLRTYYLDLNQLAQTGAGQVDALLSDFWERLARRDTREAALALLGLNDPIDDKSIKRRYRELVMAHHPDRGGDTARLQLLNAALADLLPSNRVTRQ